MANQYNANQFSGSGQYNPYAPSMANFQQQQGQNQGQTRAPQTPQYQTFSPYTAQFPHMNGMLSPTQQPQQQMSSFYNYNQTLNQPASGSSHGFNPSANMNSFQSSQGYNPSMPNFSQTQAQTQTQTQNQNQSNFNANNSTVRPMPRSIAPGAIQTSTPQIQSQTQQSPQPVEQYSPFQPMQGAEAHFSPKQQQPTSFERPHSQAQNPNEVKEDESDGNVAEAEEGDDEDLYEDGVRLDTAPDEEDDQEQDMDDGEDEDEENEGASVIRMSASASPQQSHAAEERAEPAKEQGNPVQPETVTQAAPVNPPAITPVEQPSASENVPITNGAATTVKPQITPMTQVAPPKIVPSPPKPNTVVPSTTPITIPPDLTQDDIKHYWPPRDETPEEKAARLQIIATETMQEKAIRLKAALAMMREKRAAEQAAARADLAAQAEEQARAQAEAEAEAQAQAQAEAEAAEAQKVPVVEQSGEVEVEKEQAAQDVQPINMEPEADEEEGEVEEGEGEDEDMEEDVDEDEDQAGETQEPADDEEVYEPETNGIGENQDVTMEDDEEEGEIEEGEDDEEEYEVPTTFEQLEKSTNVSTLQDLSQQTSNQNDDEDGEIEEEGEVEDSPPASVVLDVPKNDKSLESRITSGPTDTRNQNQSQARPRSPIPPPRYYGGREQERQTYGGRNDRDRGRYQRSDYGYDSRRRSPVDDRYHEEEYRPRPVTIPDAPASMRRNPPTGPAASTASRAPPPVQAVPPPQIPAPVIPQNAIVSIPPPTAPLPISNAPMLDPSALDQVATWLQITGFHNVEYRQKYIARHAKLVAVEQQRKQLQQEFQEDMLRLAQDDNVATALGSMSLLPLPLPPNVDLDTSTTKRKRDDVDMDIAQKVARIASNVGSQSQESANPAFFLDAIGQDLQRNGVNTSTQESFSEYAPEEDGPGLERDEGHARYSSSQNQHQGQRKHYDSPRYQQGRGRQRSGRGRGGYRDRVASAGDGRTMVRYDDD